MNAPAMFSLETVMSHHGQFSKETSTNDTNKIQYFNFYFYFQMDSPNDDVAGQISKEDSDASKASDLDSGQTDPSGNVLPPTEMMGIDDQCEKNPSNSAKADTIDDASRTNKESESGVPSAIVSPHTTSPPATTSDADQEAFKDEYAQYITYNESGAAIYTDPSSNHRFEYNNESNQWVPLKSGDSGAEEPTGDNPYENEYYRWCHVKNEWVLKESPSAPTSSGNSDQATEFKDGVHTYTDKDGAVFFWDTEKNAWFPKIDDDFMAIYQMNYGFIDNTSAPAKKDIPPVEPADTEAANANVGDGRKRKPEPASNYNLYIYNNNDGCRTTRNYS